VKAERLPVLKEAGKAGMLPKDAQEIELFGGFKTLSDARVKGFKLPSTSSLEWSIPEPVRKALKEALTTKPRVDKKRCELCMVCKEMCPARAMSRVDGAISIDYRECIRCFCCQEVCPVGAIDVAEGWLLKYLG
jgi:Pyruvate/2-oxoacid:ferredoxin oxidoreductase delta subunit